MSKHVSLIEEIEELTQQGKLFEARQRLLELKSKNLERALRQPLAALARRLNIPAVALILLRQIVKPSERKVGNATNLEKLEYAVALSELGAFSEAHKIFKEISAKELPQVLLYQSFAYFQTWDYKESIPLLRQYIALEHLTDYQRAVGLANLVSAAVYEETGDSTVLAERLVLEARRNGYFRILAYGLQLLAQDAIAHKRWAEAEQCLLESEGMITDPLSLDRLFIMKWKAVLKASSGQMTEGLAQLREVREKATKLKHWETVRNCDYHEGILTQNHKLLLRNYFGTPYESLKSRLASYIADGSLLTGYVWYPNKQGTEVHDWLNESSSAGLKAGTATYRLAKVLTCDFYRPIPIAEIHALVYPKQYYNPLTSPNRVHKLVGRLRQVLNEKQTPIEIVENEGAYRILLPEGCGVTVSTEKSESRSEALFAKAIDFMRHKKTFISEDISVNLNISVSSARRLIQEAGKKLLIEKVGTTKSTYYRIIENFKKAA